MRYPETVNGLTLRDNELEPFTGCNDGDCQWCPLERLAVLAERAGRPFHPHAFMYMGTLTGPAGPIHAYKHSDTRHYIHVDDAGHTYRYEPDRAGRYQRSAFTAHRSPADAIAHAYQ